MTPLVLALVLASPSAPPESTFNASGTGGETHTGKLTAISFKLGVQMETANGEKTVKGLVSLWKSHTPRPAFPTGPQLITATGERFPGEARGGDTKVIQFRSAFIGERGEDWNIALDSVAAVWLVTPPADTPIDPAKYTWLAGTPTRDVLLYRNGDTVRGALSGFIEGGVKFTPDGGTAREVDLKDLAAIGFNPRFVRARKPKGPYARLVLNDGTRVDVTELAAKPNVLVAKALCGADVEVPFAKLVALDVLQGPATYLSELKPKKAEITGFLGEGWPWMPNRNVRGRPLRLITKDGTGTFDFGIGTHPKTTLTYDLAGKYTRFESLVGLDAATGKRGRADVRIKLDGKEIELPELKTLAAGPAVLVRVDVRGVKELTLIVDFGPTGDVQADVNWGDARVVASENSER